MDRKSSQSRTNNKLARSKPKGKKQTRRPPTNKSPSPVLKHEKPASRASNNGQPTHFLHFKQQKLRFLTDNGRVVRFDAKYIYVEEDQTGIGGTTWVDFFIDKGPSSSLSDKPYLVTFTQKIGNSFMILSKDSNKWKLTLGRSSRTEIKPEANMLSTTKTEDTNSRDSPCTAQVLGEDLERHLFIMNVGTNGKLQSFHCYKDDTHVLHVNTKYLEASSKPAAYFELRFKEPELQECICLKTKRFEG